MDKKVTIIIGAVVVVVAILIVAGLCMPQDSSDHKVTYDANGGTIDGLETKTYNEQTFSELSASRDGYTLDGWYKNKECTGDKMTSGTKITSDITVYAKWTPAFELRITDYMTIGSEANVFEVVSKDGQVKVSSGFINLPDSGKTRIVATSGSEFTTIVDKDLNTCLRYKVNDQYYFASMTFEGADKVTVDVDPNTNYGYVEITYSKNVSMSFHAYKFVVKYEANEHGYFGTDPEKTMIGISEATSVLDYDNALVDLQVESGYEFDGWYTEETGGTKVTIGEDIDIITSNVPALTVYAHYKTL